MSTTNLDELISREAETIADQMKGIAQWAKSEEDVRHGCESLLDAFRKKAGLQIRARYEYGLAGGRIDSKYAGVTIEYKNPKGSDRITAGETAAGTKKLIAQIKKRFRDFEAEAHIDPTKVFGVGTDGNMIVFVRYRGKNFEMESPRPVTKHTIERLLRALVSLGAQGKAFIPDNLAADFGADSEIAQKGVRELYQQITQTTDPRAQTFFNQWKILFGEVCGYDVEGRSTKVEKLAEQYEIPRSTQAAELLFSVHSYYAIFIKFLAAEIVSSFSPLGTSTIKKCVGASSTSALKREMENLEQGGIWNQLGITNFLEGDLFSWYLSAWNDQIAQVICDLVQRLDEYDPSTLSVALNESRDLLKHLYQQLFPKSVRHDLGEYYTPDWLADHVLNEVGYSGDPDKRVLDPACGSGTFLVLAINRIKQWFDEHRHECGYGEAELLQRILSNVIGFDLNPLAVMAARTNYLLAIRDLVRFADQVELPVYLCDSIMTPAEYGELFAGAELGKSKRLKTTVGEFLIPAEITASREQIGRYAGILETCIYNEYSADDFILRCQEEGLSISDLHSHRQLYRKLQKVAAENRNGIWARIIKNAFAPLFIKQVDYIVGNPPWVNWENLPEDYRMDQKSLWQRYGLFSLSGSEGRLGGGKKDLSMLFAYSSVNNYLRLHGQLGFVITQSVFKTKGAGDGFRRFEFGIKTDKASLEYDARVVIKPITVNDMSDFQPFEGAANRTATFICDKSATPFSYPVPYVVWKKTVRGRIRQDWSLDEVLEATKRQELTAIPVNKDEITSPWLTAPENTLPGIRKVLGSSEYKAYEGVNTGGLNGCYWIRILERLPNGDLLIENLHDVGKKKVDKVQMVIESDLVYPLLRGRDVQRWQAEPSAYIILAQDPQKRSGIPDKTMKHKYPKTYAYFKNFEKQLRNRSGYKKYFKSTDPFWSMYNVGPYTMSLWKAMWPEVGHDVRCGVCGPEDQKPKKASLPDHTIVAVSCSRQQEAHFIAALLNSSPAQLAVRSYIVLHPSPHVLENISIPKYDPVDPAHQQLVNLSQRCHTDAAKGKSDSIANIEKEIDEASAQLWGITAEELQAIQGVLCARAVSRHRARRWCLSG